MAITILDLGLDVLAYVVDGKVKKADIERVFDELDVRMAGEADFSVYAEVVSVPAISLPGLLKDAKMSAQRLPALKRIRKAALVTDNNWIRMAVPFDEKTVKGVQIRVFKLAQKAEAKTWIRAT